MRNVLLLVICLIAAIALTGCNGSGGDSGSSAGFSGRTTGIVIADGGEEIVDEDGETPGMPHNPEPATLAMIGTGIAAYGLFKRKNRK